VSGIEGQTYVVTGASKGIGRAICLELAKAGAIVALLARQSDELNQATQEVQSISPQSFAVACDLANPAMVTGAATEILSMAPQLDGLVHNAGDIHPIQPLLEADLSQWSRSMMVNLVGVQHLTQALHPSLVGAHRVRVTTISSGAALRPLASWSAYCTAKAGLDMWTRCLADEGASENISAVSVAPGIVDTAMQQAIRSAPPEDFPLLDNFVGYHENGQLSQPEDVAVALFGLITAHTLEQSGQRFDVRDL
jgi:benzil reductase ((S)-benzoin forming)